MVTSNDITGDFIKSKPNTKAFDDNFDRIFRNKNLNQSLQADQQEPKCKSLDAAYERKAMQEGLVTDPVFDENKEWNEKRMDIVGANGPTGDHYNQS